MRTPPVRGRLPSTCQPGAQSGGQLPHRARQVRLIRPGVSAPPASSSPARGSIRPAGTARNMSRSAVRVVRAARRARVGERLRRAPRRTLDIPAARRRRRRSSVRAGRRPARIAAPCRALVCHRRSSAAIRRRRNAGSVSRSCPVARFGFRARPGRASRAGLAPDGQVVAPAVIAPSVFAGTRREAVHGNRPRAPQRSRPPAIPRVCQVIHPGDGDQSLDLGPLVRLVRHLRVYMTAWCRKVMAVRGGHALQTGGSAGPVGGVRGCVRRGRGRDRTGRGHSGRRR